MNYAGVRSEWRAWIGIARLAMNWRAQMSNNHFSWFFLGMAVLAPVVMISLTGRWAYGIGMGAGVSLLALALLWWATLLFSLLMQNHASARLVPGARRRTVCVVLLIGTVWTLGLAALFTLAGAAPLAALAGIGVMFAAAALFIAWPGIAVATAVLMVAAVISDGRAVFMVLHATSWSVPGLLTLPLMLVLAFSGFFRLAQEPELHYLRVPQLHAKKVDHSFHLGAGYLLRRAIGQGKAEHLLMHGLGPRMKLPWVLWLLPMIVFGMALAIWGDRVANEDRFALQAILVMFAVLTQFAMPPSVPQALARSKAEQALLRLCSKAPGAALMNAVLARAFLDQFLSLWACSTLGALLFAWIGGVTLENLLCLAPAFCLSLVHAGVMLRDYSGSAGAHYGVRAGLAMTAMLSASVALGLAALGGKLAVPISLGAAALLLLASALILRSRWRTMLAAPPALPVARLA